MKDFTRAIRICSGSVLWTGRNGTRTGKARIARMLTCVACGNGPLEGMMTAKGGFSHVK